MLMTSMLSYKSAGIPERVLAILFSASSTTEYSLAFCFVKTVNTAEDELAFQFLQNLPMSGPPVQRTVLHTASATLCPGTKNSLALRQIDSRIATLRYPKASLAFLSFIDEIALSLR